MLTPEQINLSNKSNMETLTNLTRKAFEGFEKLLELNIQLSKTVMNEQVTQMNDVASAKDAQSLMTLQSQFLAPMTEKAIAYSRHLQTIAMETQAALIATTNENFQERSEKIQTLISEIATSPKNTLPIVNIMKQSVTNANQVFESTQKAIQQAMEITTQQTHVATDSVLKTRDDLMKIVKK